MARRRAPVRWPPAPRLALHAGLVALALLAGSCGGGGDATVGHLATPQPRPGGGAEAQPASPAATPGATGQRTSPRTPSPTGSAAPTAVPATTPPATPPAPTAPPVPPPVTVALAGDVHAEAGIAQVLRAGGNPLEAVAPLLRSADFAVVNLETAVATTGTPADKQFTFNAPVSLLPALAEAGVDVVSLANNHSLDFGQAALAETASRAAEAGLRAVGAGQDAPGAYAPAVLEARGRRVAVVGLSRVLPLASWAAGPSSPGLASAYDEGAAAAAVASAVADADHVIAFVHWGLEREACPADHQHRLAAALVEAGADVVAGHHPHVLQGIERRDGALVAYSLGNFVFYASTVETRSSGVLHVTLGEGGVLDWAFEPVLIDGPGLPRPATGDDAERIAALVSTRSPAGSACRWP